MGCRESRTVGCHDGDRVADPAGQPTYFVEDDVDGMIRVLILDDDEFFCHMLVARLKNDRAAKIEADFVTNLDDAIKKVRANRERYHAFLIDHKLRPGPNGIEALKTLLALSRDTEAILLTGAGNATLGVEAYQSGAYRYLQKPFDSSELVWILEGIHGLQVLNNIARKTQRSLRLQDVANVLVQESVKLGFERARLFLVDQERQLVEGLAQVGLETLGDFTKVSYQVKESPYSRLSVDTPETIYFHGLDHGESVLAKRFSPEQFPHPIGEWLDMPLRDGNKCIAILALDNYQRAQEYHAEKRRLLRLLSYQASAAISRAISYEAEQLANRATVLARQITADMGGAGDPESLDRLLCGIRDAFAPVAHSGNFLVVFTEKDSPQWVYKRMHIEKARRLSPGWWRLDDQSLMSHLVSENRQLFLPAGALTYRRQHRLKQVGTHAARSWMGVPLQIGEQVIGAIMMEHDEISNAYSYHDYRLFRELITQLTSVIQTAWLREREHLHTQQLHLIQRVSEQLMILAEQREDWLWHAVLTVTTARFGFGFDRAVLFLTENGGKTLRGRMGLGYFTREQALADARNRSVGNANFDLYLHWLQSGFLQATEVEEFVKEWTIHAVLGQGALGKALATGQVYQVTRSSCRTELPAEFVEKFGETDYAVVPVIAGEKPIGILILDNVWDNEPQQLGALGYIDRLTNQAAFIYENQRAIRAQTELVRSSYPTLAQATRIPIKDSLYEICQQIKKTLQADIVAIYPIEKDEELWRYDLINAAWIGFTQGNLQPTQAYRKGSFTAHIMSADTLAINNVFEHDKAYDGELIRNHPMVATMGIKAILALPIRGVVEAANPLGVLYIDFFVQKNFTADEIRLAKSFAQLASLTMSQAKEFQVIETAKRRREEELKQLEQLLRKALEYGATERELIQLILEITVTAFPGLAIKPTLLLWEWQRETSDESQPTQIRRQYYLQNIGHLTSAIIVRDVYRGISGRAFLTGEVQHARDVAEPQWQGIYQRRQRDTRSEIDMPLQQGHHRLGVLSIEAEQVDAFQPEQIDIAQRIAAASALALDHVQRQKRLDGILQAAKATTGTTKLEDTLVAITSTIRTAVPDVSAVTVWYREPGEADWQLGHSFGLRQENLIRDDPKIRTDAQRVVANTSAQSRAIWATNVAETRYRKYMSKGFIQREGIRSTAAFSLRVDDIPVGSMYFHYREPHEFSEEERVLFPLLAEFVAIAMNDSLRLYEVEKERKRLRTSQEVTHAVGATLQLSEVLTRIHYVLCDLFKEKQVIPLTMLYDENVDRLRVVPGAYPAYQVNNPQYKHFTPFESLLVDENTLAGYTVVQALRHGHDQHIYLPDVSDSTLYKRLRTEVQSALCKPLFAEVDQEDREKERKLLGILFLESPYLHAFDSDDVKMILNIAENIRIAVARAQRSAELQFKSSIIGATSWFAPLVHDINRETGRIRRRISRLRNEPNLSINGYRYLSEIEQRITQLTETIHNTSPAPEDLTFIDIEHELPFWVNATVQPRKVDIEVTYDFQAQRHFVYGHPKALQRAIHDLVRNALEAMGWEKGQRLTIRTRLSNHHRWVELFIEDNGPGVAPELQAQLFNEPVSTKGEKRGYGLVFVRSALGQMGGRIRLNVSGPPIGTSFIISLPIAEPDPKQR